MNTSADTCGHCDPPNRGASACDTRRAMPAVAAPRLPAVAAARETMSLPIDLADQVIAIVAPHPAVRSIELTGSRAAGTSSEFSDWDFRVEANDFPAAADSLPGLLAPLQPLAQQWDRLSSVYCWMLIVHGPAKVDLIFPNEPHTVDPPWEPGAHNLDAIEAHFWDWMLWLRGKEALGKVELIASELEKLFDHLLEPLGARRRPASISEAIAIYRRARGDAETRFGVVVRRDLENASSAAFEREPPRSKRPPVTHARISSGPEGAIRPIVAAVIRNGEQILVWDDYNPTTGEVVAVPLAGGLEFGEMREQAVARELSEEIGATATEIRFLGALEDIFEWAGQKRHELWFVYDVKLAERAIYEAEEVQVVEPDGTRYPARWRALTDFRGQIRLVPDGLLGLVQESAR
jgi:ADP-ribose pyrophosphatase YjhB (NUDIX family)